MLHTRALTRSALQAKRLWSGGAGSSGRPRLVLAADLVYALGYALWTGVVVVLFVQVIPEAKRRQFKQALDAYEAAQRDQARAAGDQASGDVPGGAGPGQIGGAAGPTGSSPPRTPPPMT
jgi:hypothetical protein